MIYFPKDWKVLKRLNYHEDNGNNWNKLMQQ